MVSQLYRVSVMGPTMSWTHDVPAKGGNSAADVSAHHDMRETAVA